MWKIITILLLFISIFNCFNSIAQDYEATFFRANDLYKQEKYDEAVNEYQSLVDLGYKGANLYYNLGNAYLKIGEKGKAVLYYEKAFRLRPRDADVRANLNFAKALVEGNENQYIRPWYSKFFLFLKGFLSSDEMAYMVSVLYFMGIIAVISGIFIRSRKKLFFYVAGVFCILLVIILPSFIGSIYETEFQDKAVIMVDSADVRFEPNDDATVHFKVREGSVIQIMKSQGQWNQVKRYDGKMGWLKGNVFSLI
ncbi:tetratricopeptide repeat protein [Candidatus Poribacteria bacterium]|nr:tetratricopeptide repeat protein [Candidatus Poribacteria bacterium]